MVLNQLNSSEIMINNDLVNEPKKTRPHTQDYIFIAGVLLFIIAAVFGYAKLHYGFNFSDEGAHMLGGWKIATGDPFLKDKLIGGEALCRVFNSFVFKVAPDITLLGFRKLQFALSIMTLLIFGTAIFAAQKEYWYIPYVLSVFAFTGLDPLGCFSNLTYYTYPHLFITLSLSFLLLGLNHSKLIYRRLMFMVSGFFLWAISFSLLHLSPVILFPVILFILSKKLKFITFHITLNEIFLLLLPFVICWGLFLIFYNTIFIDALFTTLKFNFSKKTYSTGNLFQVNWEIIKHTIISGIFLVLVYAGIPRRKIFWPICLLTLLSVLMYFIIQTSLFGLIEPYYFGWFSKPGWFTSLLIAFLILFSIQIFYKYLKSFQLQQEEEMAVILLIPFILMTASRSVFATTGILAATNYSIPAVAALSIVVISKNRIKHLYLSRLIILTILLFPFYYTLAVFDWKFTYFDVLPEDANSTIQSGFGKGIRTNRTFNALYEWISDKTEKYTNKNDYLISYITTPMVNMITHRRPSLADNFIMISNSSKGYHEELISKMIISKREPGIAFVFEAAPSLLHVSSKDESYRWVGKSFDFANARDPISSYIKGNMKFVEKFNFSQYNDVKCFVDKKNKRLLHNLNK